MFTLYEDRNTLSPRRPHHDQPTSRALLMIATSSALLALLLGIAACAEDSEIGNTERFHLHVELTEDTTEAEDESEWRLIDAAMAFDELHMLARTSASLSPTLLQRIDAWIMPSAHAHPGHDHGDDATSVEILSTPTWLQAGGTLALDIPRATYEELDITWGAFGTLDSLEGGLQEIPSDLRDVLDAAGLLLLFEEVDGDRKFVLAYEFDEGDMTYHIASEAQIRRGCDARLSPILTSSAFGGLLNNWTPPESDDAWIVDVRSGVNTARILRSGQFALEALCP